MYQFGFRCLRERAGVSIYNYQVLNHYDKQYKFKSIFNGNTGHFIRSNVLKEVDGKLVATDEEPFMASYPELIDIGVMGRCVCADKCKVGCYQKASLTGENMSLEDFRWIIEQSKGLVYEAALGGKGDVDTHENFKQLLTCCAANDIVPNFTTSGIALNNSVVSLCKYYCGAVAVSEHFADYTKNAIQKLTRAHVKTNVHYVLNNQTIDYAIKILRGEVEYYDDINALVFLMYKPVGYGKKEYVLKQTDEKVMEFFKAFDDRQVEFKIGFDSCSTTGLINYSKTVNTQYIDYCEGARFSMYIGPDLVAMPCSFANQDSRWFYQLEPGSDRDIKAAWNSDVFNKFRESLKSRCMGCPDRAYCGGGCPLLDSVGLCDRHFRTI